MKTIVTHIYPDVDAIASVWLIHRFLPGWDDAEVSFVPAGETLNNQPPDDNPQIIHVDTGLGRFDHHQTSKHTCASQLVLRHLIEENIIKANYHEALERMIGVVTDIDHFQEVFLPDADSDIYDFLLINIIEGLKIKYANDHKIIEIGESLMDGLLQSFFAKVHAEREIKKGLTFDSKWGKTLACESDNEEVVRLAQKKGFSMVIRKSIKKGHLRIKVLPNSKLDLKEIYDVLKSKDLKASWFYHASGHMILNGSAKNPKSIPTKLTLAQAVGIVKKMQ